MKDHSYQLERAAPVIQEKKKQVWVYHSALVAQRVDYLTLFYDVVGKLLDSSAGILLGILSSNFQFLRYYLPNLTL